jgi:hypothetical protein
MLACLLLQVHESPSAALRAEEERIISNNDDHVYYSLVHLEKILLLEFQHRSWKISESGKNNSTAKHTVHGVTDIKLRHKSSNLSDAT